MKIQGELDYFIANLIEAARVYGWSGDYVEVGEFVRETVRNLTGNEIPYEELEPYETTDE